MRVPRFVAALLAFGLALVTAGCGGSGFAPSTPPPADTWDDFSWDEGRWR